LFIFVKSNYKFFARRQHNYTKISKHTMSYTSPFKNLDLADIHVDTKTQSKNMVFHRMIGEDPVLLDFLQDKKIDDKKNFKNNPLYSDPAFLNFVSLDFATNYQSLLIQHLSDVSPEKLATVVNLKPRLLTKEDAVTTWLRVELFLEEWKDAVHHLIETIENHEGYDAAALEDCYELPKIQCLNLLPPQFSWFREEYAFALNALSEALVREKEPQIAGKIAQNARLLKAVGKELPQNIAIHTFINTNQKVDTLTLSAPQKYQWNMAQLFWYTILMVLLYIFVFVELKMTFFDLK
jgi:hypothetical protein